MSTKKLSNKSKENTTSTADNVEENIAATCKNLSNARTRQDTTTDNAMHNAARLLGKIL